MLDLKATEAEFDTPIECSECAGEGTVDVYCSCQGRLISYDCAICGNCGIVDEKCEACDGTGEGTADCGGPWCDEKDIESAFKCECGVCEDFPYFCSRKCFDAAHKE